MERMEKKGSFKKKDVSDFAGKNKGPRDKSDFAKGFVPKKKDVSDFAVNTKTKKVKKVSANGNKTKTTSAPTSFGQAFAQARKKLGAGKTFTYKGKKYSTNRADDVKKTKTKKTIKPRDKKVMVDSFKKSNVNKNKKPASKMGINGAATTKKKINGGKTGFGTKAMTTKVPKKTRQGITRTPFQAAGQRKRMMGST